MFKGPGPGLGLVVPTGATTGAAAGTPDELCSGVRARLAFGGVGPCGVGGSDLTVPNSDVVGNFSSDGLDL